ncbi:cuticle protein-like [Adelges cooleyi]|uniref:cuticle protein-like n=1 Tax=Adelges cooleyi TaxID=133065 RepID=UPI00217F5FBF|nr:cuticle protein-like [Adelges cooleyi]
MKKIAALLLAGVCLSVARPEGIYNYAYGVNDPNTGDQKDQQETKIGEAVKGFYRVLDADGQMRIVNYLSDLNGFQANVVRSPVTTGGHGLPVLEKSAQIVDSLPNLATGLHGSGIAGIPVSRMVKFNGPLVSQVLSPSAEMPLGYSYVQEHPVLKKW